jgi:hypothetical protein
LAVGYTHFLSGPIRSVVFMDLAASHCVHGFLEFLRDLLLVEIFIYDPIVETFTMD